MCANSRISVQLFLITNGRASPFHPHKQELSPMVRSSPHTPRMGLGRHAMQETSFSNNTSAADTDATVAKINSMFPTVPETHIRMLLKK